MSDEPELMSIAELVARQLKYKDPKFCGKGSFKETYRAEDHTGCFVALKLVDRTRINVERTDREIEALKSCNSIRIAKVLAATTFSAPDKRVFDVVVEEFFDGGSLEDRLKIGTPSREEVVELVTGLVLAVRELQPNLVHRQRLAKRGRATLGAIGREGRFVGRAS